jgi:hypothetical protein
MIVLLERELDNEAMKGGQSARYLRKVSFDQLKYSRKLN